MSSFHSAENIDINTMLDLLEARLNERIDNTHTELYSELNIIKDYLMQKIDGFSIGQNRRLIHIEDTLTTVIKQLNERFNIPVPMPDIMPKTLHSMYAGGSFNKTKKRRRRSRRSRRA